MARPREGRLSLFLRGSIWWVGAHDPVAGKTRQMSLRLRSPKQDAIARAKHKDLQSRWRRGEMIFPDQQPKRTQVPAAEAIEAFMATRKGKVADTTWRVDFNRLRRVCAQAGAPEVRNLKKEELDAFLAATPIRDLKHRDIDRYLDSLLETGTKTTWNQYMLITRSFLAWCQRRGWRPDNPLEAARILEPDQPDIVYLDKKQRAAVLKTAAKDHYHAMVATALYAGPRLGELVRLEIRDVDLKRKLLAIKKSKTRRGRSVPLDRKLAAILRKHISARRKAVAKSNSPLFTPDCTAALPEHTREKRMAGQIQSSLNKYIEDLSRRSGERCGWNIFRHTFGSLLAQQGVSLYQIAEWMGNSPNVCRRHYAALSGEWSSKIEVR